MYEYLFYAMTLGGWVIEAAGEPHCRYLVGYKGRETLISGGKHDIWAATETELLEQINIWEAQNR